MEGTKACTMAIMYALALVAGQTYNIPAGIVTAHNNTVCPPDTHLDAAKTELSNSISDILASSPCRSRWRQIAYLPMARTVQTSGAFGNPSGDSWDDVSSNSAIVGVRSIAIRHGAYVDRLQITYLLADGSTYTALQHGGVGGGESSFTLAQDEMIIRVEGEASNVVVNQLTFITQNSSGYVKTYGPYGLNGETPFAVEGYVVGFSGRSDIYVNQLRVHYLPPVQKNGPFGGDGGEEFADPIETHIPPIVNIRELRIRHGNGVESIGADYELLGGGSYEAPDHGGSEGTPIVVTLVNKELIVCVSGKTNATQVGQFAFTARKQDGSSATYGPYGITDEMEFGVSGRIVGFFGRSGEVLNSLGVFSVE